MEYAVINNELAFPIYDGFHIMDEEERSRLNFLSGGQGTCLTDPERKIIISIGWSKVGRMATMLLNTAELAKNMEARASEPMADFGYELQGFVSPRIGVKSAEGFDYGYDAEGVRMFAESLVVKHRKTLYYLHFYCHWDTRGIDHSLWEDIIREASWK